MRSSPFSVSVTRNVTRVMMARDAPVVTHAARESIASATTIVSAASVISAKLIGITCPAAVPVTASAASSPSPICRMCRNIKSAPGCSCDRPAGSLPDHRFYT